MNPPNSWKKSLPTSRIVRPNSVSGTFKYVFWRFYTPFHPYVRDSLLRFGFIQHVGRQDFLIGHIAPGWSTESVVEFLLANGYGNHFIAWVDDDEVIGLRHVPEFTAQYHIRIFKDGEIRAHYEYTPECYPIKHMKKIGQQDRRHEFLALLGNRVTAV